MKKQIYVLNVKGLPIVEALPTDICKGTGTSYDGLPFSDVAEDIAIPCESYKEAAIVISDINNEEATDKAENRHFQ
jgi:hypothetical protein